MALLEEQRNLAFIERRSSSEEIIIRVFRKPIATINEEALIADPERPRVSIRQEEAAETITR